MSKAPPLPATIPPGSTPVQLGHLNIKHGSYFAPGELAATANTAAMLKSGEIVPVWSAPSAAASDVLAERRRQIEVEGYTPDHDDAYLNDDIAAYATYYAMPQAAREWPATETGYGNTLAEAIVPEGWPVPVTQDRRRELVKAAALVLAAIEQIDREAVASAALEAA